MRDDTRAPAFRDVDRDERVGAVTLVAMMDATDAWPAVQAGRAWVLERTSVGAGTFVVDVGCGPGTFGRAAAARGATTVALDRAEVMVAEARRRGATRVVRGDVAALPLAEASVDVAHLERVLQWVDEPSVALAALARIVRPGGWLAVTDTVWASLAAPAEPAEVGEALGEAAAAWVPHPAFVSTLPDRLDAAGWLDLETSTHEAVVTAWVLDDPAQAEGPPGLPLRTMAAAVTDPALRRRVDAAVERLSQRARFDVRLMLLSVVARRP